MLFMKINVKNYENKTVRIKSIKNKFLIFKPTSIQKVIKFLFKNFDINYKIYILSSLQNSSTQNIYSK